MITSPVQFKVLVVDDSVVKRRMAKGLLEKAGHTVIEAEHTNDGLAKLGENPEITYAVVDFQMPLEHGGNGDLFARKALCMNPMLLFILHSTEVGTDNEDLLRSEFLFHRQTARAIELPELVRELSAA